MPLIIVAQPAPDFTITDSDGLQHELYADHLNQGKTVVLKIFFTYCPPCNTIAPDVEALYQDWGGGDFDVEFISLSNRADDMNTDVAAYKIQHSNTFPGAGADGGSLQALQPYIGGTYGFFFATPTFVVIAPDGTVNFDPRGPGNQATLDSVSAAIAATGALMPVIQYNGQGQVNTANGLGINNVELNITELPGIVPVTDSTGAFDFSSPLTTNITYELTAEKNNDSYTNGLSTADLILISRHILGIDTFTTPEQRLAADADRNSKITTLDLIQLRKLIIGQAVELQNQPPWIFINPAYQFITPHRPFSETYDGEASEVLIDFSQPSTLNFTGIKIGDVNNSVDPGN
jgi:thiol-disulfide isomerase/thioredoxin